MNNEPLLLNQSDLSTFEALHHRINRRLELLAYLLGEPSSIVTEIDVDILSGNDTVTFTLLNSIGGENELEMPTKVLTMSEESLKDWIHGYENQQIADKQYQAEQEQEAREEAGNRFLLDNL